MIRPGKRFSVLSAVALAFLPAPALAALVTLTGTVTDANGVGIPGVQINFVDSCTGALAAASGNTTSSTGTFRAIVNAGHYDLQFEPPAGTLYVAYRILDFDLTASRTLAPIALPFGVTASGKVTDATGLPLANVYLHFFPPGVSSRVFTAHDKTDLNGNYGVVVPAGTYDLRYGPPAGTRHLAVDRASVAIPGNTALPTVALPSGLLVGGTVYDSVGAGKPVVNVNIDAIDAVSGAPIPLSHDRTDATGTYVIAVPAGSYYFQYQPEKCTLLVAQESAAPVTVAADTTLPRVTLQAGVLVTGTVTDTRSVPVFDVNTAWYGSSGIKVFTINDHTDAAGAYSVVVPPDTYRIDYAPPAGMRLAGVRSTGVLIGNNPPPLPTVQLPDGFFVTGRNIALGGAPIDKVTLSFFVAGSTTQKVYVPRNTTDAAGRFTVVVPPGLYDVRFEPPTTTLAARRLLALDVRADLPLGDVLLERGFVVSGHVGDSFGTAVVGADLDFFDALTGEKAETPHDNTDTLGNYSVVVPPRVYDVAFVPDNVNLPPPGVPLETARITGVTVTAPLAGLNAVLRDAFLVQGRVRDAFSQPVGGADLDFYLAGTAIRQYVSRDNTAADGTYGVYVPPGTYDILFTPPAGSGYALARLASVLVDGDVNLPDVVLNAALAAGVSSIAPATGPSTGGTAVTITGSNFQPGAAVTLGGFPLRDPLVLGSGQISGITPAFPIGPSPTSVGLTVTNVGSNTSATLPGAFTFSPAATSINVTVARSSNGVVLSWASTGQPFYTIYRSPSPARFGPAEVLTTTTVTTFTDIGADGDGVNRFYRVE